jgi:alkylation response protein AidB-like acyl-CoA dehydrogenase
MDFKYTETQEQIAAMVRDFANKEIRPKMMEWDESQYFPVEVFQRMGELGLMGVLVPQKYGGSELSYFEYVTVVSEVAKVCSSIGLSTAAHNSLCTGHILYFGNEEQKAKYLPKLASGEWIGAWGLTEANTGSDAGNMRCTATRDGDDWILNGTKNWITHGISGNVAVVLARGTPGFSAGKKENKLGMRASETAELIFDNCRISDAQRMGEVGEGFKQAMKVLDGGRISIAALSLGIAKGAYEAAVKYAKERQQFDQPIANFQAIAFKLADMAVKIEAAEMLIYQAADLKNRGEKMTKESAMAKMYASEICVQVATDAVQIFGGYGYTKDFPVEKFYRDSKLCTIGEGTTEIQKLVISRDILGM